MLYIYIYYIFLIHTIGDYSNFILPQFWVPLHQTVWLVDSQNVDGFREVSSLQPPAHVSVNHTTISNYCIHSGVQCKYQGSACGAHK